MKDGHSDDAMGCCGGASRERVLCVCRSELPASWLPSRGSVALTWEELEYGLHGVRPQLRPRDEVEAEPALKQLIPYGLLCRSDGTVACYQRQGDEQRLHGLMSIGVGGHVSEDDVVRSGRAWRATLVRGLLRELREEIPGISVGPCPPCLGLVNEDTSAVGRVHIGVVCRVEVCSEGAWRAGPELGEVSWVAPDVLRRVCLGSALEVWSALALELLGSDEG